jgi:hypothetical protein
LPGILPGKSVSRGRAFRQHIHVLANRHRHPCRCPLGGLSTPTHRRTGAPGRAAGHPGPHFQKKQEQRRSSARGLSCSFTRVSVAEPVAGRLLATLIRPSTRPKRTSALGYSGAVSAGMRRILSLTSNLFKPELK